MIQISQRGKYHCKADFLFDWFGFDHLYHEGSSVVVQLTSCLTGLDLTKQVIRSAS